MQSNESMIRVLARKENNNHIVPLEPLINRAELSILLTLGNVTGFNVGLLDTVSFKHIEHLKTKYGLLQNVLREKKKQTLMNTHTESLSITV